MEDLTLLQLGAFLAGLVAFIKGAEYLIGKIKNTASEWIKTALKPITAKLDDLTAKIDEVDMDACKNYLTLRFEEAKRGTVMSDASRQRVHEVMERYTSLGGNSYVKEEFENLKNQGKI